MNINIYKTQTMLAAILKMIPVNTFLRNTFFPNTQTFVTEDVLLDYQKGKRKMAPFVAPRVGGVTVDREGYRTDKYTAPKIAPQRILTVDDLMTRGLGENVFSQRTPAQRQAELLAKDLTELEDMVTRREEWMSAQLIFEGKITMKGYIDHQNSKFIEQELDYGFTNKEVLAGDARWGQVAADIYSDLEEWRLEVIKKSGRAPTICLMGRDAIKAFRKDENIMKMFDIRNMIFGQMNPTVQADGITYIGRLTALGLDIYTYDDWYLDDDGTEKPYVPADHIALLRPGMGEILYGAVTQMENGQFVTYEGSRVPKSWAEENNEQRMVRLTSRPVPKPDDVDDWFVAKVV